MIILRCFTETDAAFLREKLYPSLSLSDVEALIAEWSGRCRCGKHFEMYAVVSDGRIVGTASLCEQSKSMASAGIEIFPGERKNGFAFEAMQQLFGRASGLGYRILVDQVREDNAASIGLHEKLGFESDRYAYKNKKDRNVFIYIKVLD